MSWAGGRWIRGQGGVGLHWVLMSAGWGQWHEQVYRSREPKGAGGWREGQPVLEQCWSHPAEILMR